MAFERDGKELYGVYIETLDARGEIQKSEMYHIHAESSAQAKMHFAVVFPDRRRHHIVAAAPLIGYFVKDKEGKILSAT